MVLCRTLDLPTLTHSVAVAAVVWSLCASKETKILQTCHQHFNSSYNMNTIPEGLFMRIKKIIEKLLNIVQVLQVNDTFSTSLHLQNTTIMHLMVTIFTSEIASATSLVTWFFGGLPTLFCCDNYLLLLIVVWQIKDNDDDMLCDRELKKITNYTEIFSVKLHKNVSIMQKTHWKNK